MSYKALEMMKYCSYLYSSSDDKEALSRWTACASNIKRFCFHNTPNVLRAIRLIHALAPHSTLSRVIVDPITSQNSSSLSSGSVGRAIGQAWHRIADFPDQYASCEGIQDSIDKAA